MTAQYARWDLFMYDEDCVTGSTRGSFLLKFLPKLSESVLNIFYSCPFVLLLIFIRLRFLIGAH